MPTDVILDVDTGVDDALALLLAAHSPALRLLGVTCVHGNVPLDLVLPNTLDVLSVAGRDDVPVAAGMARPLAEPARDARGVHGQNGLGGIELPRAARESEDLHAVEFLRRTITGAAAPLTLIPLAPLTNIATLLSEHPEVRTNIERIVFMGGAIGMGNASATSEFNVRQDPEAADIVLRSGIPTVMYGLEVFRQVVIGRHEATALVAGSTAASQLAGRLLLSQMDRTGLDRGIIGDAGCVASVIDPGALTTRGYPARVELQGQWTRGQTVVDQRPPATVEREAPWQAPMETRIEVAVDVDGERYRRLFLDTVGGSGG